MIAGFLNVVCNVVLEGKHSLNIHISCAGYKISFIVVFACELKSYQMTTVINVLIFNEIVGIVVGHSAVFPACGCNRGDLTSILGRHDLYSYTRDRNSAPSESIKRCIFFICIVGYFLFAKEWVATVDLNVSRSLVFGDFVKADYLLTTAKSGQQ